MARKKLSRNSPCPCGTGKKYKHCCYRKGFDWEEDDAGTVRENLCNGGPAGRRNGSVGRRTATEQSRADCALNPLKPAPDPPEDSVATGTVGLANGGGNAAGDGPLEELPHGAGGHHSTSAPGWLCRWSMLRGRAAAVPICSARCPLLA